MCYQCKYTQGGNGADCLTSSTNDLKECPGDQTFCVIIEEYTKNSKCYSSR